MLALMLLADRALQAVFAVCVSFLQVAGQKNEPMPMMYLAWR
jgi:hypothetical protein